MYKVFNDANSVLLSAHRYNIILIPFTFSISIDKIHAPNRNTDIRSDITIKVSQCLYMFIDLIHFVYINTFPY